MTTSATLSPLPNPLRPIPETVTASSTASNPPPTPKPTTRPSKSETSLRFPWPVRPRRVLRPRHDQHLPHATVLRRHDFQHVISKLDGVARPRPAVQLLNDISADRIHIARF